MKKIAFTGPASSGKTTIAKKLKEYLDENKYETRFLTGNVRSVLNELNINLKEIRSNSEEYSNFQSLCLSKHIISERLFTEVKEDNNNIDFFITDRTYYDYIIYTMLFTNIYDFDRFYKKISEYIKISYDIIFYTEPLSEYHNDGIRDISKYDLEKILYNNMVKPISDEILEPNSVENRLECVLKKLGV